MRKAMRKKYTSPKVTKTGRVAEITQDPFGASPGNSDPGGDLVGLCPQ